VREREREICTHTQIYTLAFSLPFSIHTYVNTYVCMYIRMYVHTYVCTYMHTYVQVRILKALLHPHMSWSEGTIYITYLTYTHTYRCGS
jgi:hypothetical protein